MNDLDAIIKLHEKLIYKLTLKFYGVPKEDLFQAGVIGLIKAYYNFKDDGTTKFTTYAYNYIFGEMYELQNNNRDIKLNKKILKIYKQIERTKFLLSQKLNREPSFKEVADYLEIDEKVIYEICSLTSQVVSLDLDEKNVYDTIPSKERNLGEQIDIEDSMKVLNKDEQDIIKCRYFKDYTQTETANILGMSQVTVSRYEKKSLKKMYNYLSA